MASLLIYPDPPPPEVVQTLELAGYGWVGASSADAAASDSRTAACTGAVVCLDNDPDGAWAFLRAFRKGDGPIVPVMLLIGGMHVADLSMRDALFEDFCLSPFHPRELEARVRHLTWKSGETAAADVVEYSLLALNLETYQAAIAGRPLDLTFMEYELLKFLAQHPGKVFTREVLLSRVWGYEYYGGARTVDVHIRRLRAKLGEEHANLIETVRSVGYRFGQSRWGN
jgi:two-component system, OmpR family, alkaline phosphatase synthesis response regulator PhoP